MKIKETINELSDIVKKISKLGDNEDDILNEINSLMIPKKSHQLKELSDKYLRKNSDEPVGYLRRVIIEKVISKEIVTKEFIEERKNKYKIKPKTFSSWNLKRLLMPLLITSETISYIKNSFEKIQSYITQEVRSFSDLKYKTYIFDKGRNFFYPGIWFSCYNKSYPSPKNCKQLFFEIVQNGEIKYGFSEKPDDSGIRTEVKLDDFDVNKMIDIFKENIDKILNDINGKDKDIDKKINQNDEVNDKGHDYIQKQKSNLCNYPLNQILYGPPGTGKTYHSKRLALEIISGKNIEKLENRLDQYKKFLEQEQIQFITFHQSYGYEEFVEGIKPILVDNNEELSKDLVYKIKAGIFKQMCEKASREESKQFVLIIDEINRGNISKIFGELITLIEEDKRINAAEEIFTCLPYSNENFGVPGNLYIIGTMNTADRSIALMDNALRRRFKFVEMMAKPQLLRDVVVRKDDVEIKIEQLMKKINERIEFLYDRDHTIGHSFFWDLKKEDLVDPYQDLCNIFSNKLIPLLQEYFYDDWEKIQMVLGDHLKQFENFGKADKSKWNEEHLDKKYRFVPSFTNLEGNKTMEMQVLGFDHEDIDDTKVCYKLNNLEDISALVFTKIYDEETYDKIKDEINNREKDKMKSESTDNDQSQ
ncbi:AAA family ATPase [bacterium]|nr:AAA family ATPase [bacterium]